MDSTSELLALLTKLIYLPLEELEKEYPRELDEVDDAHYRWTCLSLSMAFYSSAVSGDCSSGRIIIKTLKELVTSEGLEEEKVDAFIELIPFEEIVVVLNKTERKFDSWIIKKILALRYKSLDAREISLLLNQINNGRPIISTTLLSTAIREDNEGCYRHILEDFYVGKEKGFNIYFEHAIILIIREFPRNFKYLDILNEYIARTSEDLNYITRIIFSEYEKSYEHLEGLSFLLCYAAKKQGKTLEELFVEYCSSYSSKRLIIPCSKLVVQSFYNAGLPYSFIVEQNSKYSIYQLARWLVEEEGV